MENTVKFSELYIGTPDGETEAKNSMFEQLFVIIITDMRN